MHLTCHAWEGIRQACSSNDTCFRITGHNVSFHMNPFMDVSHSHILLTSCHCVLGMHVESNHMHASLRRGRKRIHFLPHFTRCFPICPASSWKASACLSTLQWLMQSLAHVLQITMFVNAHNMILIRYNELKIQCQVAFNFSNHSRLANLTGCLCIDSQLEPYGVLPTAGEGFFFLVQHVVRLSLWPLQSIVDSDHDAGKPVGSPAVCIAHLKVVLLMFLSPHHHISGTYVGSDWQFKFIGPEPLGGRPKPQILRI